MKLRKGSEIHSVFTGSCPVCNNSNMYRNPNPYSLFDIFKMNELCSHCGTKFKMEPSFFFGAMYVSYGLGAGISIASFLITHFIFGLGKGPSFLIIIGLLIILYPILIRFSRNIWINLFLKFDPEKAD